MHYNFANPRSLILSNKIAFLLAGFAIAAWAPIIPFIKVRFNLDEHTLGFLLLCVGGGAFLSAPVAGLLTSRFGCRLPIFVAAFLWGVCLVSITLLQNIYILAAVLVLFGMVAVILEIISNINGTFLEKATNRNVMSGLQALYSVGSLTGSVGVTFLLGLNFGVVVSASCAVACSLLLLIIGGRHLISDANLIKNAEDNDLQSSENKQSTTHFQQVEKPRYWANPAVLLVGMMLFIIYLLEGAMLDWSGVFLSESRSLPLEQAGYGFAAFSVTMVVFRFLGDRLVEIFGRRRIIVGGTILICISLNLAIFLNNAWVSILCFACAGIGSSNVIPQLVSFAAQIKAVPMHISVTLVNAIGFTGVLAGPALIGFLAHAITLPYTFVCLAFLVLVVAFVSLKLIVDKSRSR